MTRPEYLKLDQMAALKFKARSIMSKNNANFMRFDLLCYQRGYNKIDMYFFCN
jgi:hypothetical protein